MTRAPDRPVVAVYRRLLLAPSETFIRGEALAMERYQALFVGQRRRDGLELPRRQVLLATPGGARRRALRRRLPRFDPVGRLARGCRAHGVRLVHAHFGPDGLTGLELARWIDVPLVVTFHGFDATMSQDAMLAKGGGLADFARRRTDLFEHATLLLAVSGFIADELRRQGAPAAKLRVHHLGTQLPAAAADGERERAVLFVGRHVEKKGLGDLIEAMADVSSRAPGTRLIVVGDGPLRPAHEQRAHALGLNATFTGWQTPDEVAGHLRRVRVLCVPSRRASNGDAEGLPTVIPEAGAHGLPVVGTRHSGIPEAIGDTAGLLVDEGDVTALAEQLLAVLSDGDLWTKLSAGARANVRANFELRQQAAELERLYDEALDGPTAA